MLVHRFRELLIASEPAPPGASLHCSTAFVACPSPVLIGMSPLQQVQTDYLYRLALEQAQAQVAEFARPSRWPAFSVN